MQRWSWKSLPVKRIPREKENGGIKKHAYRTYANTQAEVPRWAEGLAVKSFFAQRIICIFYKMNTVDYFRCFANHAQICYAKPWALSRFPIDLIIVRPVPRSRCIIFDILSYANPLRKINYSIRIISPPYRRNHRLVRSRLPRLFVPCTSNALLIHCLQGRFDATVHLVRPVQYHFPRSTLYYIFTPPKRVQSRFVATT